MLFLIRAAGHFYVEFVVAHGIVFDVEAFTVGKVLIVRLVDLLASVFGLLIDLYFGDNHPGGVRKAALDLRHVGRHRETNGVCGVGTARSCQSKKGCNCSASVPFCQFEISNLQLIAG